MVDLQILLGISIAMGVIFWMASRGPKPHVCVMMGLLLWANCILFWKQGDAPLWSYVAMSIYNIALGVMAMVMSRAEK